MVSPLDRLASAWSALIGRTAQRSGTLGDQLSAQRGYGSGTSGIVVTPETALRHSAVWACLRLRANLVSSLPVDVFRMVDGIQFEMPKAPVFVEPWAGQSMGEFLYASQYDLDRYGNVWGVIRETAAGSGLPVRVELVASAEVSVLMSGRAVSAVRVNGETIPADRVWHEKQYTPAGFAIGMSPILAAATSIGGFLASQKFASQWFEQDGSHPSGVLKNTERVVERESAEAAKAAFKAAVVNRDIFVVGKDWEWTAEQVTADSAGFLSQMQWGVQDVARFLDVPGDMIDAPTPGGTVTYANVSSRMLQLLVLSMAAAIKRREDALSRWLPRPRFVKLNTAAILRMDPEAASRVLLAEVAGRVRAPSEVRALMNLDAFTPEQVEEFSVLFGARAPAPVAAPPPTDPATQQNKQTNPWEVPA